MKGIIFVALGITTVDFAVCLLVYLVAKSRNKTVVYDSGKEICAVPSCGRETNYRKDSPISERLHYIEGAGQLCDRCVEYEIYPVR